MADSDGPDHDRPDDDRNERRNGGDAAAGLALSTLRVGLALLGLVVLLFGVGMAMGIDVVGMAVEVLETEAAQWLLVALFGLLLILVAINGFQRR